MFYFVAFGVSPCGLFAFRCVSAAKVLFYSFTPKYFRNFLRFSFTFFDFLYNFADYTLLYKKQRPPPPILQRPCAVPPMPPPPLPMPPNRPPPPPHICKSVKSTRNTPAARARRGVFSSKTKKKFKKKRFNKLIIRDTNKTKSNLENRHCAQIA